MDSSLNFRITDNENNLKLREYLRKVAKLSGRLIKGAAIQERIKVNDKVVKLNYILKKGDVITFDLTKEENQNIEPEKMDLEVVYEDMDIIVINKPSGMVVHPTKSYPKGTLANGLLYYFREKKENCIVRLVSRLDMDTSGLILVAKNQFSHMALARDMRRDDFQKNYLAIVHGKLEANEGTINLPIYRPEGDSIKRVIDNRGQESITHFSVVKEFKLGSVVKLALETGRTHQIRVHLSYIGNPIYGDNLYGTGHDDEYIGRQALHAYRLSFPHPRSGKIITLESELPEDMLRLVQKLSRS